MQLEPGRPRRLLALMAFCTISTAFGSSDSARQAAVSEFFSPAYGYTLSVTPQRGQPFDIHIRPGTLLVIEAPESGRTGTAGFPRHYSGDLVLRAHPPDEAQPGESYMGGRAAAAASFRLRFEKARVMIHRKPLDLAPGP